MLIILQPTPFCNLDCNYCYLPDRQNKKQMSTEVLKSIFKLLFSSSFLEDNFTVVWHSGEPLTLPIKFYQSAFFTIDNLNEITTGSKFSFSHSFQTNGTLITENWCEFLQQSNSRIGVSIDGPCFIHDTYRKTKKGLGTYNNTIRGLKLLQKYNISFYIITVLTNQTLDYPDEIFNFYVQHEFKNVCFNIEEIEGNNYSSSLNRDDCEKRYRHFMRRIYELNLENDEVLRIREFESIKSAIYNNSKFSPNYSNPFSIISFDYEGNFSTFSPELLSIKNDHRRFILGNAANSSLELICRTKKFQKIYNEIKRGIELCKLNCDYYSVCGGGSPSNKFFENGTFESTETLYCKLHKKALTDIVLEKIELNLEII